MSRFLLSGIFFICSAAVFGDSVVNNDNKSNMQSSYSGMLIVKNDYVRFQDCAKGQDYTLIPSGKYGYEAMAELISFRKNTPEDTLVNVGLQGEVEYNDKNSATGNFLVRGLEFIKKGENCYAPISSPEASKILEAKEPAVEPKEGRNVIGGTDKSLVDSKKASSDTSVVMPQLIRSHREQSDVAKQKTTDDVSGTVAEKVQPPILEYSDHNKEINSLSVTDDTSKILSDENLPVVKSSQQIENEEKVLPSSQQIESSSSDASSQHVPMHTDAVNGVDSEEITETVISKIRYFKEE